MKRYSSRTRTAGEFECESDRRVEIFTNFYTSQEATVYTVSEATLHNVALHSRHLADVDITPRSLFPQSHFTGAPQGGELSKCNCRGRNSVRGYGNKIHS